MKYARFLTFIMICIVSLILCSKAQNSNGEKENDELNSDVIELPAPDTSGGKTLNLVLGERRSIRDYAEGELTLQELSQILWAGSGITDVDKGFRTAPSAGALYPIEIYLFTDDGVFQYEPAGHLLKRVYDDDRREEVYDASLKQSSVLSADVIFVLVGFVERTSVKYGERALRYIFTEAGHICQNMLLEVTDLGLGAVPIGAFEDDEILEILNLSGDVVPLYIITVGRI